MLEEILRLLGYTMTSEVAGRAHDHEPERVGEPHLHHVALDGFGQSDTRVVTLGDDVDKAILDGDLDVDAWVLAHGGGAIVNTSSGAGIIGIKGSPAYTAAKHGVIGLTRAAALDYAAHNVRINAICPGYIDTPMIARYTGGTGEGRSRVIAEEPIGRMGRPEEIAATVVYMCSDAAAFMIGHALVVDGGQTIA